MFSFFLVLKPLVSLISRTVACSTRIADRHTHTKPSIITLAAHAYRGLIKGAPALGALVVPTPMA